MSMGTIGVEVTGSNASESVEQIQRLEDLGVRAAWATSGGDSDPITLLAIAAMKTDSILLGTSIVPTWPRHPITTAQQVNVIAHLAPGRFRLGLGPSHYSEMYEPFRFDFRKPLTNLARVPPNRETPNSKRLRGLRRRDVQRPRLSV